MLAGDARPGVGVMFPAGGTKKHDATQAGDNNENENKNENKNYGRVVKAFFGRQHLEANVRPYLKATTSSHPHMHGCWCGMLRLLAGGRGAVQGDTRASLKHFWDVLVEGDLFDSQSHEKKYLGMMIFEELLPMVDAAGLKLLLTQKFIVSVGSSILSIGNGAGLIGSVMVTPMPTCSMPPTSTMSVRTGTDGRFMRKTAPAQTGGKEWESNPPGTCPHAPHRI